MEIRIQTMSRLLSWKTAAPSAAALFLLTGCVSLPETRSISCSSAKTKPILVSSDGHSASVEVDVLTYNLEGLKWPARPGRGRYLEQIGAHIAMLRSTGKAPDIILFQEVFSKSAMDAAQAANYPSFVAGPARTQRRPPSDDSSLPGNRRAAKGEIGLRMVSGGLVIVSEFPMVASRAEPFPKGSCAGFDCLANKGMLLAEFVIPGVPGALTVVNTHMNAQGASRVAPRRYHAAHARQVQALSNFLGTAGSQQPLILGGDFNMQGSDQRFALFEKWQALELVHRYCMNHQQSCDVEMSWDGDAPWMDTQDLQLSSSSEAVTIRPIRVDAMFDGASEPKLSDHDGFRVTYQLSWQTDAPVPAKACIGRCLTAACPA
jgi:endonuclease/exonuclease/phosphatase family metal-dependent hydrolase